MVIGSCLRSGTLLQARYQANQAAAGLVVNPPLSYRHRYCRFITDAAAYLFRVIPSRAALFCGFAELTLPVTVINMGDMGWDKTSDVSWRMARQGLLLESRALPDGADLGSGHLISRATLPNEPDISPGSRASLVWNLKSGYLTVTQCYLPSTHQPRDIEGHCFDL